MINQINIKQKPSKYTRFESVIAIYIPCAIGGGLLGFAVKISQGGVYFPLLIPLFFIILYFCALRFPVWYMKRDHINLTLIKWIAWSNVITWLIPILGFFTAIATMQFGLYFSEERKKYRILGSIGLTLTCINYIIGLVIKLHHMN